MVPLVLFLLLLEPGHAARDDLIAFAGASANSVNSGGDFKPENALNAGPDYWCTETGLGDTDVATLTTWFDEPQSIQGLVIKWAHSAREIKILGYPEKTSISTQLVLLYDWHAVPSNNGDAFEETIEFSTKGPQLIQQIIIQTRGVLHTFIGIEQVQAIVAGMPMFQLVSGVTTPDVAFENCLQVQGGVFERGTSVVLDPCHRAIASGDGREVWQITASGQILSSMSGQSVDGSEPASPLCLFVRTDSAVIDNCDSGGMSAGIVKAGPNEIIAEADRFAYQVNGQLEARSKEKMCLSLKGEKLGSKNLAEDGLARVSASSVASTDLAPERMLTESLTEYWSSAGFNDPGKHIVTVEVDMGEDKTFDTVEIDWEYPALQYSIDLAKASASSDFRTILVMRANPLNLTRNEVGERTARVVRITMIQPHPKNAKVDTGASDSGGAWSGGTTGMTGPTGTWVYGVRRLSVLARNLTPTLAKCDISGRSPDARDKWFKIPVKHVDTSLSARAKAASEAFRRTEEQGTENSAKIQDLAENDIKACKEQTDQLRTRYEKNLDAGEVRMQGRLKKMAVLSGDTDGKDLELSGLTIHNPAASCHDVKTCHGGRVTDGFYALLPECAPRPLRLYCNMDTGNAFIYQSAADLKLGKTPGAVSASLEQLQVHCASLGLDPLVLSNLRDVQALTIALANAAEDTEDKLVPLSFDLTGRGHFTALGSLSDTTQLLGRFVSGGGPGVEGEGLVAGGDSLAAVLPVRADERGVVSGFEVVKTNWRQETDAGTVCSLRGGGVTLLPALLRCDDNLKYRGFRGILNTNFLASCPKDCHLMDRLKVYGGADYVYASESSICRAALHAGVDLRSFVVSLETGLPFYHSTRRYGIQTDSVMGSGAYSFRLSTVARSCPVNDALMSLGTMQKKKVTPQTIPPGVLKSVAEQGINTQPTVSLGPGLNVLLKTAINKGTEATLNATRQAIDSLGTSLDKTGLLLMKQAMAVGVAKGRGMVKPITETVQYLDDRSFNYYGRVEAIASKSYEEVSRRTSILDGMEAVVRQLKEKATLVEGYRPFKLSNVISNLQASELLAADTFSAATPTAGWLLIRDQEVEHFVIMTGRRANEMSDILDGMRLPGLATSLGFLRGYYYFDAQIEVLLDMRAKGDRLGIAFRVRDGRNMLLVVLESLTEGGTHLAVSVGRVQAGKFHFLSDDPWEVELPRTDIRAPLGPSGKPPITDAVVRLSVTLRRAFITVGFPDSFRDPQRLFFDEILTGGTVGFVGFNIKNSATIKEVNISPLPCDRSLKSSELAPVRGPKAKSPTETTNSTRALSASGNTTGTAAALPSRPSSAPHLAFLETESTSSLEDQDRDSDAKGEDVEEMSGDDRESEPLEGEQADSDTRSSLEPADCPQDDSEEDVEYSPRFLMAGSSAVPESPKGPLPPFCARYIYQPDVNDPNSVFGGVHLPAPGSVSRHTEEEKQINVEPPNLRMGESGGRPRVMLVSPVGGLSALIHRSPAKGDCIAGKVSMDVLPVNANGEPDQPGGEVGIVFGRRPDSKSFYAATWDLSGDQGDLYYWDEGERWRLVDSGTFKESSWRKSDQPEWRRFSVEFSNADDKVNMYRGKARSTSDIHDTPDVLTLSGVDLSGAHGPLLLGFTTTRPIAMDNWRSRPPEG